MDEKSKDIKGQTIVFNLSDTEAQEDDTGESSTSHTKPENKTKKPTCIIVLGMAGSGKTTFVQRLASHLHMKEKDKRKMPYVINLDPACMEVSLLLKISLILIIPIWEENIRGYILNYIY